MKLDDSYELIVEVLNNRLENRVYQEYLATLTVRALDKDKRTYEQYRKSRIKTKNHNSKKMSEETKKEILEKNNKIIQMKFKKLDWEGGENIE